jgi:hypothetical protein
MKTFVDFVNEGETNFTRQMKQQLAGVKEQIGAIEDRLKIIEKPSDNVDVTMEHQGVLNQCRKMMASLEKITSFVKASV